MNSKQAPSSEIQEPNPSPHIGASILLFGGLVQILLAGLMPMPNAIGLLTGLLLMGGGALVIYACRNRQYLFEKAPRHTQLLTGLLWLVVSVDIGMGLGPSQMRPNVMLAAVFAVIGVFSAFRALRHPSSVATK